MKNKNNKKKSLYGKALSDTLNRKNIKPIKSNGLFFDSDRVSAQKAAQNAGLAKGLELRRKNMNWIQRLLD